jgi:UDP-2,4-diacetamido-2,4,6-trideoxy-beta-L-altropyranose hydrolase
VDFERQLLLIRADANGNIGIGHLMRCLALAQAWQSRGGEAIFVTACPSDGLRQRLSQEGFQIITLEGAYPDPVDWAVTSKVLAVHPQMWVVLDGYHFDPSYQRHIKEAHHPLLVIDDMAHLEHYYADVVLNQNVHATQLKYSCEPYTQLLLGTRYVLLRREFRSWREWQREFPQVARKVLVTLGGADPDNQTLKVIHALGQVHIDGLEATVIVGPSNPYLRELETTIYNSQFTVRLVRNASTMPELMSWADLAVSGGGSTCWELAFMGLPNISMVLAENQRGIADGLSEASIVLNLGWFQQVIDDRIAEALSSLLRDRDRRQQMSRAGRTLVNGGGSERVVLALKK